MRDKSFEAQLLEEIKNQKGLNPFEKAIIIMSFIGGGFGFVSYITDSKIDNIVQSLNVVAEKIIEISELSKSNSRNIVDLKIQSKYYDTEIQHIKKKIGE